MIPALLKNYNSGPESCTLNIEDPLSMLCYSDNGNVVL